MAPTSTNARSAAESRGKPPEQGAKRAYPEIQLKHGDRIQVGDTLLDVLVTQPKPVAGPPALEPAAPSFEQLDPKQLAALLLKAVKKGVSPRLDLPAYEFQGELGRGGFGVVFKALRKVDGKPVAIKVLLPRVAVQPSEIERFLREMSVTAQLRHPNIVTLLDQGHSEGIPWFVMDYCDGGSLWDLIQQHGGKVPLEVAKPIMLDALKGLAHAHEAGFVHRDLKPQNILLDQGTARISDFGLAKNFQQAGFSGMSLTGNYAGSPLFMPREQLINFKYVKPTTDVWSLAATFYFMLTGQFPYPFTANRDPIDVILNEHIVPIEKRLPTLSTNAANGFSSCLCPDPKKRPLTALEMTSMFSSF